MGDRLPKRLALLGDRRPFFRFNISSDQQKTLEAAARRLTGRALFIYAAPVFGTTLELFAHMNSGTIVQHSTFPDVLSLSGHSAWYYNEPGAHGVVNAEFESRRLPLLDEHLARLIEVQADQTEQEGGPSTALAELRRELQAVVLETSASPEARGAFLMEEWRQLDAYAERVDVPPAVISFLAVEAFAVHFNLLWLTLA